MNYNYGKSQINEEFLKVLEESFKIYLNTSSRSNEKLKILHSFIANSLQDKLNQYKLSRSLNYTIHSLGIGDGKEITIDGRYMPKNVDITIKLNDKVVAGIAVKYVMSNYKQNANNYFENMLGETANIRTQGISYYHIVILFEELPYYTTKGEIYKWEKLDEHNIEKYRILSTDNPDIFFHTPNKTLLYVIRYDKNENLSCKDDFKSYYEEYFLGESGIDTSKNLSNQFGNIVIYNNFDKFISKIAYHILSL